MPDFKQLSRSVKGLTVLVTGAASGMGRATAHVFAAEGANVAVTDLSAEATQAVADEITAKGGSAKAWVLDVANPQEIIKVVGDVARHFGADFPSRAEQCRHLQQSLKIQFFASVLALQSQRCSKKLELPSSNYS